MQAMPTSVVAEKESQTDGMPEMSVAVLA